ncbi:MAG: hypothetical protein KJO31_18795 [Gammaproteobacteria bacterium]|nr:hypothetical protein [Gammaproteobacteria bacterium]
MKRDGNPTGMDGDPAVSGAYRRLATERAPDHLDRAVLREAALAATSKRALRFGWLRPFAFVATVGLSLAFVLQITDSPQPNGGAEPTMPAGDADLPATLMDELKQAPIAGGDAQPSTRQRRPQAAAPEPDVAPAQRDMAEDRADKKESAAFSAEVDDARRQVQLREEAAAMAEPADRVASQEALLLARIEQLEAALQMQQEKQKSARRSDFAASVSKNAQPATEAAPGINQAAAYSDAACKDAMRSSSAGWLGCIRGLLAAGRIEAAESELAAYEARNPATSPAQ